MNDLGHRNAAFSLRAGGRVRTGLFILGLGILLPGSLPAQEESAERAPAQPDSSFPQSPLTPGGAFIRSLVIPGWAQAELGAQSRGALYFFVEAFSIFMLARTKIRLDHAELTELENPGLVDARQQQLEDWAAIAVFTALFSAADGWISVQLFGFDERTGLRPEGLAFSVGWKVPFGP